MLIETKFNLGDFVVPIRQRSETISEPCPECEGTGRVALLKGGTAPCQSRVCHFGKVNHRTIHPWALTDIWPTRVGKVEVVCYEPGAAGESRTTYMLALTGIGSGQVWYEHNLFPTDEEAQRECELRNAAASVTESAGA